MSSPGSTTEGESQSGPADAEQAPPFFNTTFSTHRVSPLHVGGEPLEGPRLEVLARRLRDVLIGGAVRGVEIRYSRDDQALSRAGTLETVHIHWTTLDSVLRITRDGKPPDGQERPESRDLSSGEGDGWVESRVLAAEIRRRRVLHFSLIYEEGQASALLLPPLSKESEEAGLEQENDGALFSMDPKRKNSDDQGPESNRFVRLPLLLVRMPPALKTAFIDFLSNNLDCRISSLHLGTRSLVRCWETWANLAGFPSRGPVAKDLLLTLGFYTPPSDPPGGSAGRDEGSNETTLGVKSIDIIIPAADLPKFLSVGKRLSKLDPAVLDQRDPNQTPGWRDNPAKRRRLAGRLHEEGWGWRRQTEDEAADGAPLEQPFTEALGAYANEHLALDLFHPGVRITKIACGGFVLTDGRLKVLDAEAHGIDAEATGLSRYKRAVWALLVNLVAKASGADVL